MGSALFWTLIIWLVCLIFNYHFCGGILGIAILSAVIILKIFLPKEK